MPFQEPRSPCPAVQSPDGRRLAESNAILFCPAPGTDFWPGDSWGQARALQWMFFEQYSHEPYIAVVRSWRFAGLADGNREALREKMERGYTGPEGCARPDLLL